MRESEQTNCLINEAGWQYMAIFDGFPPETREMLRNSPFNLCAACVGDVLHHNLAADVISKMEHKIRCMEEKDARLSLR